MARYADLKRERDEAIARAVEAERLSKMEEVERIRAECEYDKQKLWEEIERLNRLMSNPAIENFLEAVKLEAAHQQQRWGSAHDSGKNPADWFWLLGYLGGKALHAAVQGDVEKALHHTISSAAVLMNWHHHLSGERTGMRPGIAEPTSPQS